MKAEEGILKPESRKPVLRAAEEMRFVNEMRLSWRQWLWVAGVALAVLWGTPRVWRRVEKFETGQDYRIPYALSKDYWLYRRWLDRSDSKSVVVLGDSVVWGEYVAPDGTLSHFLNQESPGQGRVFVNGGMNGLFPLALEGLIRKYGGALKHRKVILHCNLLWMSSPKSDLSTEKEEPFNHVALVPQFEPAIPCYRSTIAQRLSYVVQRNVGFLQWVDHLQNAYYGSKNILSWTLEEDPADSTRLPNAYRNPLGAIRLEVPRAPADDPERGPKSPRHRAWFEAGMAPQNFEWVPLKQSLQWGAFQRLVNLLRERGNEVLVVIGPFNEWLIQPENAVGYRELRDGAQRWFKDKGVAWVEPAVLPRQWYADASHPLTDGYRELAKRLWADSPFRDWATGSGQE